VTGVQTCALPIWVEVRLEEGLARVRCPAQPSADLWQAAVLPEGVEIVRCGGPDLQARGADRPGDVVQGSHHARVDPAPGRRGAAAAAGPLGRRGPGVPRS